MLRIDCKNFKKQLLQQIEECNRQLEYFPAMLAQSRLHSPF